LALCSLRLITATIPVPGSLSPAALTIGLVREERKPLIGAGNRLRAYQSPRTQVGSSDPQSSCRSASTTCAAMPGGRRWSRPWTSTRKPYP